MIAVHFGAVFRGKQCFWLLVLELMSRGWLLVKIYEKNKEVSVFARGNFFTIKTRNIQNIQTVFTGALEPSFTEVIISRFRFITHTYIHTSTVESV